MKKFFFIAAAALALAGCSKSETPAQQDSCSTENCAYQSILTRTSVRQWDMDRTVSADTVDMILRAAMSAPTAMNKQPWAFVVLTERAVLDSVATCLPWSGLNNAPIAIITCADMSKVCDGETVDRGFWIQDVPPPLKISFSPLTPSASVLCGPACTPTWSASMAFANVFRFLKTSFLWQPCLSATLPATTSPKTNTPPPTSTITAGLLFNNSLTSPPIKQTA